MELLGIEMPLEEFDRLMCEQSEGKELKVVNGEVIAIKPEPTTMDKISMLKMQLFNTDYKAIKYAEGLISDEEYAPIKAQRQAWRDEINELEQVL